MFSVYKKIVSPDSSPISSPMQSPILNPTPNASVIVPEMDLDMGPTITGSGAEFLSSACNCCSSRRDSITRTITVQLRAPTSDTAADSAAGATNGANNDADNARLDQYINYSHSTHYQYSTYTPRGIQAFDI
jgi:hypothetical protein